MTIKEAGENIGKTVMFRTGVPNYENRIITVVTPSGPKTGEIGVLTEVNERYAFVLYMGDRIGKATAPHDLELIET